MAKYSSYEDFTRQVAKPKNTQTYEEFVASLNKSKHQEIPTYSFKKPVKDVNEIDKNIKTAKYLGQEAIKGGMSVLDLPQALRSIGSLGRYKPDEYASEYLLRQLNEAGGPSLNQKPENAKQLIAGKIANWGSSVVPAGKLGKAAAAATKLLPASRTTNVLRGTVNALTGANQTGAELAKSSASAAGLGGIAGSLQGLFGVDEGTASLVGLTPAVPAAAKLITSGIPAAINAVKSFESPVKKAEKQLSNLSSIKEDIFKSPVLKEINNAPELTEETGKAIRNSLIQKLKPLQENATKVGEETYGKIREIKDKMLPENTIKHIDNELKHLSKTSQSYRELRKIKNELSRGNKMTPSKISRLNSMLSEIKDKSSSANTRGKKQLSKMLGDVATNLQKDLDVHPEVAKASKAYAEAKAPVSEIIDNPKLKNIFKKTKFGINEKVTDSEITSLLNLGKKNTTPLKSLYKHIKNDPETLGKIREFNRSNLLDHIKDSNGINIQKLESYIEENPNIFMFDPKLKIQLDSLRKKQISFNENLRKLSKQSDKEESFINDLLTKAATTSMLGAIGGPIGATIGGTLGSAGSLLSKYHKNKYKSALSKGLEEFNQ